MSEYFHVMDAGATLAVPDERESSLRLASGVLDSLGFESSFTVKVKEGARLSMEMDDLQSLSAHQLARVGSSNLLRADRINSPDPDPDVVSSPTKLLDDAAKRIAGFIGVVQSWTADDDSSDATAPIVADERQELANDETVLGVTICMLDEDSNDKIRGK